MCWFAAYYIYTRLENDLVILHYNVDFGLDSIGPAIKIFNYPLVGFSIIIFNILLYIVLGNRSMFMVFFLIGVADLVNIIMLMVLSSIYLINIS